MVQGFLTRGIGLPPGALEGDLDHLYVSRLLEWVRASSLDAVVLLAHEQVYDDQGRLQRDRGSFHVPNGYVLELSRQHPEFLAGVSIHPGRPDALAELEQCVAGGAVLMKCLPNCQNIDCADRRYTRFWERMAAAGLPLLVHTGGEVTVPVVRAAYADPRRLAWPLECGVTVIAAHCATRSLLWDPQYFFHFEAMTARYPRLYGDTSALLAANHRFRGAILQRCLRPPLAERLVHGSDYPVPVWAHWAWLTGAVGWAEFRRWQRYPNPLERDYQLKRALGFPAEHFTRIQQLMPPARRAGRRPLPGG